MIKILTNLRNRNIGKSTALKYSQSIKIIDEDVLILKSTILDAEKKYGHQSIPYDLFGTFIFIRICFRDILTVEKYIKTVKAPSERNLFARTLALFLYELLDDMGQLFGKRYETYLASAPFKDDLKEPLNQLRKAYNAAKQQTLSMLKEIRHNTIAHKDHDALRQLRTIENIDISEVEIASAAIQIVYLYYISFEKQLRMAILKEAEKRKDKETPSSSS